MTRDAKQPSLEALQTLLLYAELGEVAGVAAAIGLDPAVISRRLRDLRLKHGLIEKRGRGLAITERGRAALPAIRALLRQQAHLAAWLADRQDRPQVVSIATGNFGARFYLPKALARFVERHPEVQVTVQIRRGRERILGVADGTFDLAIVSHDQAQIRAILAAAHGEAAALRIVELTGYPLVLMCGKDTAIARQLSRVLDGQTVPVEMLASLPLVGLDFQSGIRRQIEACFRSTNSRLTFRYEAGGWEAAKEYARFGLGAAVVPGLLVTSEDRRDFVIRDVPLAFHIRDMLIDREAERVPAHEAMRLALRNVAKTLVPSRW